MFRADVLHQYGDWDMDNFGRPKMWHFKKEVLSNTKDTFFMIFGPDQQNLIPIVRNAVDKNNGVVLYQSPQAINFGYDDKPRNTLIVFEFNEVQV